MRINIFTTQELECLIKHEHRKLGKSLLDHCLYPITTWLQVFVPAWISPNMLTILAHLPGPMNYIYLLWCSPNAREEVPSFAPLVYGYQLFHWTIIDNMDGVHARKTQQCSSIGKILDSGLDQVSWILSISCLGIILKLGNNPLYAFWVLFLTGSCGTGDAITSIKMGGHAPGWIDLTEFAAMKSFLALMVYLYGDSFIYYELPFLGNVQSMICGILCLSAIGYLAIAHGEIFAASGCQNSKIEQLSKTTMQNLGLLSLCGLYITLYSSFKDDPTLVFLAASGMASYLPLVVWRLQLRELVPTLNVGIQYEYAGPVVLVLMDLLGFNINLYSLVLGFMTVSWTITGLFFLRVLSEIVIFTKYQGRIVYEQK